MDRERYDLIQTLREMQNELAVLERPRHSFMNSEHTNSLLLVLGALGIFFLIGFVVAIAIYKHSKRNE